MSVLTYVIALDDDADDADAQNAKKLLDALDGEYGCAKITAVKLDELAQTRIKRVRNDDIAAFGREDGHVAREGVVGDFEVETGQPWRGEAEGAPSGVAVGVEIELAVDDGQDDAIEMVDGVFEHGRFVAEPLPSEGDGVVDRVARGHDDARFDGFAVGRQLFDLIGDVGHDDE